MSDPLRISSWPDLNPSERRTALARPGQSRDPRLLEEVRRIVQRVRLDGDSAVTELTARLDGAEIANPRVARQDIVAAWDNLDDTARRALEHAWRNIDCYHRAQRHASPPVTVQPGVICEQARRPIDAVGLYVPGGSAPLPSALLMLAVPAAISGCARRVVCSPPQADGRIAPIVLATAALCGIEEVYAIGGAQAIAAMAYGTDRIAPVAKIFGPGNAYVTAAKMLVAQDPDGAACDLPAGPSEVLVIADEHAHPAVVAADLLAQAEHGADSHVLLLTDCADLAAGVSRDIAAQLPQRARASIIRKALANAQVLVCASVAQALQISNRYAPEHLILNLRDADAAVADVTNAGAIFVGPWAAETFGDYCSGTNHVLPTYGFARAYSGVTLSDFEKSMSVQRIDAVGFANLATTAITLARMEGLDAHAAAISVRQKVLAKARATA